MAKMSELMIDVEEMLRAGIDVDTIAKTLGVPYQWVKEVAYAMDFTEEA